MSGRRHHDATRKVMGALFTQAESSLGYFHTVCEIFGDTGCRSRFIPIVIRYFGLIANRPRGTAGKPAPHHRSGSRLRTTRGDFHSSPLASGQRQDRKTVEPFQDRLVSEFRLAKAKTVEQAAVVLDRYLSDHNRRFSKPPSTEPAWRKVSALQIEQSLCFKQQRTVAKDNTMTLRGQSCRSLSHRLCAPMPTRESMCSVVRWRRGVFLQKRKIASFDSKTTHTIGLYRTQRKKEGFRDGPISMHPSTSYHHDIFTLLLT